MSKLKYFYVCLSFFAALIIASNASAIKVHGGVTFFDADGNIIDVLAINAQQTDDLGGGSGMIAEHYYSKDKDLDISSDLFTDIKCMYVRRPDLIVIYGSIVPPSLNPYEGIYDSTVAVLWDRGDGEGVDRATPFYESSDNFPDCEALNAFSDSLSDEVLEFYASYFVLVHEVTPKGNISITP